MTFKGAIGFWTAVLGTLFLLCYIGSQHDNLIKMGNDVRDRDLVINELHDKQETLDLAMEFGYDPMIVQVTRELSKQVYRDKAKHPESTWRLVPTEKHFTYMILSLIQTESRGDVKALNPSGATGLTQLLLSTAKQYDKDVTQADLQSIPKQLKIAVQYFVDMLDKYHGNVYLAVLSWNRGPGAVDRAIAFGQSPDNGYAKLVFTQAAMRNAGAGQ